MWVRFESGGVGVAWQSSLLEATGAAHAFGTRHVGVAGLMSAAGMHGQSLRRVRQVHGCDWVRADLAGLASEAMARWPAGDAVVARASDVAGGGSEAVGIVTADCVPILLAARDGSAVAAVHAGWRGLVAGVVEAAVAALKAEMHQEVRLCAAVGPCLCQACFEVGNEVAEAFEDSVVDRTRGPKPHVDLAAAAAARLAACGVDAADIDPSPACTACVEADYFSHRRDVTWRGGEATGRMLSVIEPATGG